MKPARSPRRALAVLLALALALDGGARAAAERGWPPAVFAEVAPRAVAATVSIATERPEPWTPGLDELAAALGRDPSERGPVIASGTGSGVIVRADGLVLTNHHVVSGAVTLVIELSDRRRFPARLLASDARTDVALLKIEGEGPFPVARIGDSEALRVGDPVMTVGHPYDFAFTVTAGIVSARGRRNVSKDEIQDYIQTDAAVNPGASGGPLFDRRGEVVGITTAIYSSAQAGSGPAPVGLSFAIPSRMAWRVAEELLAGEPPSRSWIGLVAVDEAAGEAPGVRVRELVAGGPAASAGVLAGDQLLAVNGEVVRSRAELAALISSRAVGERLSLRVRRGEEERELWLDVVDRRGWRAGADGAEGERWAGMRLGAPVAPEAGLRVLAVEPGSAADLAGLRPGDLIRSAGGQPMTGLEPLRRAAQGRRAVVLELWRRDGPVTAVLIAP